MKVEPVLPSSRSRKLVQLIAATSLCVAAPVTLADTIGVYAGAGVWMADFKNSLGKTDTDVAELGIDDDNTNVFYVAIEHPIPLLPNLRIQHTALDTSGTGTLSSTFTIDDTTFTANTQVQTEIDLTHTDWVLYYEVLDNWVNLDLGINARQFDGKASVRSDNQSESVDLSGVLPMLYTKAQFDLPFSGWSLAAELSGVAYSGNHLLDGMIKIAYESDLTPLVGLGLEAGYRQFDLQLDDLDDLDADLKIAGPYAGVTVHF